MFWFMLIAITFQNYIDIYQLFYCVHRNIRAVTELAVCDLILCIDTLIGQLLIFFLSSLNIISPHFLFLFPQSIVFLAKKLSSFGGV